MTTAGKPTFDPARGGSGKNEKPYNILSKQFSSRDLPGQLEVKTRLLGQDSKEELKNRDFKKELLEREKEAQQKKQIESKFLQKLSYNDDDDPIDTGGADSDESNTDDEEETAALLAELQRIRKERAEEKSKKAFKSNLHLGNRRTWNDDVIFKNCAKDNDRDHKKNFINDMLRSDFHRRFMDKYIK
ncbi:hypothetical protein MXB_5612 [Myxobolus squamalis]|nr:hypothetical protein MXB_5612 [Myxobolus squamalis]